MVVTAVCVQFLNQGYGMGFSAPSLGQVKIFYNHSDDHDGDDDGDLIVYFSVFQVKKEELLTSTELEYFASSLVLGQVILLLHCCCNHNHLMIISS